MLTLIIVGNSTTQGLAAGAREWVYTPRGYTTKHGSEA